MPLISTEPTTAKTRKPTACRESVMEKMNKGPSASPRKNEGNGKLSRVGKNEKSTILFVFIKNVKLLRVT